MPDYLVTWESEQWAVDPHEAALKAWQDRSGPGSLANTFIVTNPATGVAVEVTLPCADSDGPSGDLRAERFEATFRGTVTVDACSTEEALRLLENVDFELMSLGGPTRLGLVRTLLTGPFSLAPAHHVAAGTAA